MTTQSSTTPTTIILSDGNKPLDLLHEIWKHRVRNYNDAFLESPRRNTRNYSKRMPRMEDVLQVDPNHTIIEATTPRTNGNNKNNNHHVNSPTKSLSAVRDLERIAPARENDNNNKNHHDDDQAGTVETGDTTEIIDSVDGKGNTQTALSMQDRKPNDEIPTTTSPKSPVELALLVSEPDDSMGANLRQHNNTTPISELDDINNLLSWTKQGISSDHHGDFVDASAEMRFHFLYFNDERQLCFQTDATPDSYVGNRRCVFCYFDGGSNAGLLMHCVTCHGHYLSFKAARNEDGTVSQEKMMEQTKKGCRTQLSSTDFLLIFVFHWNNPHLFHRDFLLPFQQPNSCTLPSRRKLLLLHPTIRMISFLFVTVPC
jgi:transcription elongation GreA/GreB family factor